MATVTAKRKTSFVGLYSGALGKNEQRAAGGYMEGNQRKNSRMNFRGGPEIYTEGLLRICAGEI